jgi:hypothetical protein
MDQEKLRYMLELSKGRFYAKHKIRLNFFSIFRYKRNTAVSHESLLLAHKTCAPFL